MMTIKAFARLCGCSTQTLRYYDRIDLLKPVSVDKWSGYRYYAKAQAVDFVKIKNLQAADFAIGEIKELLALQDEQVYEAFERKIAQQTQKLERIKEIQQSYLMEKSKMEKLVQNATDYILHAVSDYQVLQEFGLTAEEGPAVMAELKAYMEEVVMQDLPAEQDVHLLVNDQVIRGADQAADAFAALMERDYEGTVLLGDEHVGEDAGVTADNAETLWDCHGWKFVREFVDDIPLLEKGFDYCFCFELTEDKYSGKAEFPLFMMGAMLRRTAAKEIAMSCTVERSKDSQNHFALLRKKRN